MIKENKYCDLCKKKTTEDDKKIEELHGLLIELGFSKNGWGRREDFIPQSSFEICTDCFTEVESKIEELRRTIGLLRGEPQPNLEKLCKGSVALGTGCGKCERCKPKNKNRIFTF